MALRAGHRGSMDPLDDEGDVVARGFVDELADDLFGDVLHRVVAATHDDVGESAEAFVEDFAFPLDDPVRVQHE